MIVTVVLITLLYLFFALAITIRLQKLKQYASDEHNWEPQVTVIVAIRNEAPQISRCLQSLAGLDYPSSKLQILIVNDASNDESGPKIEAICRDYPWMKAIHLGQGEKKLPGKAGAVLKALESARGEVIFLTDADCQTPVSWLRILLSRFDENTGLVCGITNIRSDKNPPPLFEVVQSLDWQFLLAIAAVAIDLGRPLSWMGNNMAFRRIAYDAVGGYPALGHSLIEDFALLDAIARKTVWRVAIATAPEASVTSTPLTSLQGLYHQRRRWALGIGQVRPLGKLLMISSFVIHLIIVIVLFIKPLLSLGVLSTVLIVDFLISRTMARTTNYHVRLSGFLSFEIFYFIYSLILPFLLFFDRRIQWKDQDFSVHA